MIRVLMVDDHQLFREGMRLLLKKAEDIQIVGEARDGQEAVAVAQRLQPDVILMDIEMPGMNGFQATQELTAAGNPAQILILSMRTDERDVRQATQSGAKGYLIKNIGREELIETIRSVYMNRPRSGPVVAQSSSANGKEAQSK